MPNSTPSRKRCRDDEKSNEDPQNELSPNKRARLDEAEDDLYKSDNDEPELLYESDKDDERESLLLYESDNDDEHEPLLQETLLTKWSCIEKTLLFVKPAESMDEHKNHIQNLHEFLFPNRDIVLFPLLFTEQDENRQTPTAPPSIPIETRPPTLRELKNAFAFVGRWVARSNGVDGNNISAAFQYLGRVCHEFWENYVPPTLEEVVNRSVYQAMETYQHFNFAPYLNRTVSGTTPLMPRRGSGPLNSLAVYSYPANWPVVAPAPSSRSIDPVATFHNLNFRYPTSFDDLQNNFTEDDLNHLVHYYALSDSNGRWFPEYGQSQEKFNRIQAYLQGIS